jgi:DNA processing protein
MRASDFSDADRLDWLRLIRSENVGPVTFRHLLRHYGSARKALEALPELARRARRDRPIRVHPASAAEKEIAALAKSGGRLIAAIEPDYPAPLYAIEDAPPLIAVKGDAGLLAKPAVALVGARDASANGRRIAETLAGEIGRGGFVVVSGLARGIDTAAHRGALATGTVAVLAGGLDVIYPPENDRLYAEIAERGALVAEQPFGAEPLARHFPRRNRIISGLSRAVVVVEAALRSGSLITARQALEQGRDVLAVPGSPLDPRCRGANNLIREGAGLVETAEDVFRALGTALSAPSPDPAPAGLTESSPYRPMTADDADKARSLVFERLSPSPTAVDELVRQCQLSAALVATALLELELAGRIERHPGNRVARIGG